MSRFSSLALPAAIGVVAGMRSMTAPAVVSWAAQRGMLRLGGSSLLSMGAGFFSRKAANLATAELLADKLPFTPDRTSPGPMAWRTLSGAACGAAISSSLKRPLWEGAALGAAGAIAGALAGHYARRRADSNIAAGIIEDVLAIGIASAVVWQAARE